MAESNSFDVTTGVDYMEAHNAVDQATKEITQRYDFKGLKVSIELNPKEKTITLAAPDEYKLKAMWDVLQSKMTRRGVPLKNLKPPSRRRSKNCGSGSRRRKWSAVRRAGPGP